MPALLLVSAACDDGDDTKNKQGAPDAGADGSVSAGGSSGSAGSSAGGAGAGGTGGTGATGGTGGTGGTGATGGTGGTGLTLPSPLFSVGRSHIGASGSAVASTTEAQSNLFHPDNPGLGAGSNTLGITAAQLGLLDTDSVDGFSVLRAVPSHPVYYFSVQDGATGGYRTQVERRVTEAAPSAEVFFSDGVGSHDVVSEGGEDIGYNAAAYLHGSLGLSVAAGIPSDDVDALELEVGTPSEVYFSVDAQSVGASGSAVEGTAANERGCTIYRSRLDGTNEVAYTCTQLGLVADDEVDALVVVGAGTPSAVSFSVSASSVGVSGSAVNTEATAGEVPGDVFGSDGSGTNTVLVDEVALGLNASDNLNALSFREGPSVPRYSFQSSCNLTPSPLANTPNPGYLNQIVPISGSVVLMLSTVSGFQRLSVYDAATCAQIGSHVEFDATVYGTAFVQVLSGWSATDPLNNIQLWSVEVGTGSLRLNAFELVNGSVTDTFVGTSSMYYVQAAVAPRGLNQVWIVGEGDQLRIYDLPTLTGSADGSLPDIQQQPLTRPVFSEGRLIGYDSATSSLQVIDDYDYEERHLRGASLNAQAFYTEPAWTWTPQMSPPNGASGGFIAPGVGMYRMLATLADEVTVYRYDP
ncbi:MAG: hypothetical protein KC766_34720 [Myxococcales bacterium]|nr:hypothetical protein [Myxococcales bacterium]